MPDISRSIFFKKVITFRCNDDVFGTLCILKKKKSPPTAHQLMFLFLYSMIVYWYIDSGLFWAEITEQLTVRERDSWRLHMWVNSRATVSLAASIFSWRMSRGRRLTFVMEITFRNGSKMEHFTFVIKWLLLQMSSWPGEEHDDYNTSAAAESHLIHLFGVINKTSLCIHGGVFVEAGRLNLPAN